VAIHQYLDVLRHLDPAEDTPARRQAWIDRCLMRTKELQDLIADWLALARIEGGTLLQERVKVDLTQVLLGILRSYREMAEAEGVSLEASLPVDQLWVLGDRNCLSVAFDNLITNAIKYNRPGGTVAVSGAASDGEIVVAVADTGQGIPEKYLPSVFDEFFRVKEDGAKKTEGTGLGLPIAKRIVSEMGGSIELESQAGVGSTFRVHLPAWRDEGDVAAAGGAA
jgi:signal transduction histidine kinase